MQSSLQSILQVVALLLLSLVSLQTAEAKGAPEGGDIKGVVFDKENKEPLIGARVQVVGTSIIAMTDKDGVFVLKNVPTGSITLEVSYIFFETERIENLDLKKGEVKTLEIQLVSDDAILDEVVVVAKASRASEIQLIKDQRTLTVATQAIGANELSRKGIGNAEAAVAQLSGVSKQEGVKNLFVRGLGDRYNATFLNDFPMSSDDLEYKNIALDLFDTDMIQNISVQKAFGATFGGDVGGAAINITSQELFQDKLLQVGVSAGANSGVLGARGRQAFKQADGANYWGVTRHQLPTPKEGVYPFPNKLQPTHLSTPIQHSVNLAMGRKWVLGSGRFPLSLYLVGNHSKGYNFTERVSKTLAPIGGFASVLNGEESDIHTRQMLLVNATLGIDYQHELRYNHLLIHSNSGYVTNLVGMDSEQNQEEDYGYRVRNFRQQMNENLLRIHQLDSDWQLAHQLVLNVGVAYNKITAREPDRRTNALSGRPAENGDEQWVLQLDSNKRFYSTLREGDLNPKAKLTWNLSEALTLFRGTVDALRVTALRR